MPGVGPIRDHLPHDHNRDDFGGLCQHLGGEADELEGLVLAPAAEGVGNGGVGVLVERRAVPGLLGHGDVDKGYHQGQNAIHKHQELGIGELLPVVGLCHHPLLLAARNKAAVYSYSGKRVMEEGTVVHARCWNVRGNGFHNS